jgi:hypothetical protein
VAAVTSAAVAAAAVTAAPEVRAAVTAAPEVRAAAEVSSTAEVTAPTVVPSAVVAAVPEPAPVAVRIAAIVTRTAEAHGRRPEDYTRFPHAAAGAHSPMAMPFRAHSPSRSDLPVRSSRPAALGERRRG